MSITNSRIGSRVTTYQPDLINVFDSSIGDESIIATFVEIGGADVGSRCDIGAYVKISPTCKVGDDAKIGHNTVLMKGARLGNNVKVGNCCVIATNVRIEDNAIVDDNVCVTSDVGFGDHVRKEVPPMYSPQSRVYANISAEPAISSDHPARKIQEESKIEWRSGKPYHTKVFQATPGEPVQMTFEDLFNMTPEGMLSKTHACKGKCMEEPKSDERDPAGFDLFK